MTDLKPFTAGEAADFSRKLFQAAQTNGLCLPASSQALDYALKFARFSVEMENVRLRYEPNWNIGVVANKAP